MPARLGKGQRGAVCGAASDESPLVKAAAHGWAGPGCPVGGEAEKLGRGASRERSCGPRPVRMAAAGVRRGAREGWGQPQTRPFPTPWANLPLVGKGLSSTRVGLMFWDRLFGTSVLELPGH